jgi:hypothetical protein
VTALSRGRVWRRVALLVAAVAVAIDMSGIPHGATAATLNVAPASDVATEDRILALDPEHISAKEVNDVLSRAPAPRIISLQGSLVWVTMQPFSEYLVAMGVPEERLRNPANGTLSYSSFVDSEKLAGTLAWYYENEGMMPMLIGHSQGGMVAIRVLYELAGAFHESIDVWNPVADESEHRTSISDPSDGRVRPVVGLKVPFAAALATGKLPRLLLGQWTMLGKLRSIPDSVEEFTGFTIPWDPIAGTFPGSEPYRATGMAIVRNVDLPATASHIGLPNAKDLAMRADTRAWIDRYRPGEAPPPVMDGIDTSNLLLAADIWFSVKKHWCLEAQRVIRQRRVLAAGNPHG